MELTPTLMILELLVCTGSLICSIAQFKLKRSKRNKKSAKVKKPDQKRTKDKKQKD